MQEIITKDSSITFRNEKYGETYHSVSGALEEAFEKFARPCNLKNGMKVLDICFGLGYNSLAAISLANVEIVGLENDITILEKIQSDKIFKNNKNRKIIDNYNKIRIAARNLNYRDEKMKMKIILADARESIKKLNEKFDVVFLDPFSPKKCPELWTKDFLNNIAKVMKKGSVLATYSCARVVRENLKAYGFVVKDGPCVGRNAPSTLAFK